MKNRVVGLVWACVLPLVWLVACAGEKTFPDAAPDIVVDAAVECFADGDCNDGVFCNGTESCGNGICQSGEVVDCSDGIACTVDICSNERRECLSSAPDVDGDGHGDKTCKDGNGVSLGDDCDDLDGNRFPGNVEFCDAEGHDEDCDSSTFGNIDVDEDGVFSAGCCNTDEDSNLVCGADCDDNRANIKPGVSEVCDGLDNDCNGSVDEGVLLAGFFDGDGDGYGDDTKPLNLCPGAGQFSTAGGDCNDAVGSIHPNQAELCDNADNDCDNEVDETPTAVDWFLDADGDGFGSPDAEAIVSCAPIPGRSIVNTDCDDSKGAINPSAAELCDGIDNDCNGLADFQIGVNDFEDDDNDGLVDISCPLGTDCDDTNPVTGPGTVEQCDGQDNDCDGNVDENVSSTLWFRDNDSDGFGSVTSGTLVSCQAPLGYSVAGGDCDDGDDKRNPNAQEACNATDDDCDSAVDETPAVLSCANQENSTSVCQFGECENSCNAGYLDCNQSPNDGCESNSDNDSDNCGQCNNFCSAAKNQIGICMTGSCICEDGFSDCDNNPENGCETDLSANPNNCGSCGNTCAFDNALSECNSGTCAIQLCLPDYDNCDGNMENGCESLVNTDTQCGSCGNDCTAINNTNAVCMSGPNGDGAECVVLSCSAPNFQDCTGGQEDGCETDIDTSVQHCGNCFNDCNMQEGATGACNAGNCECEEGFAACGFGFGCSTNILSDFGNCGGCNIDCGMADITGGQPECQEGACVARCDFNRADCNGSPESCETFVDDINNCGDCNVQCPGVVDGTPGCNDMGNGYECVAFCEFGFSSCDADPMTCETNVSNDPDNCGGCGNSCGASGVCSNDQCDWVESVALGQDFTCALRQFGGVACWGSNSVGQLGNSATGAGTFPVPVAVDNGAMTGVGQLAAGAQHVCATASNGTYCWGRNEAGQLGVDTAGSPSNTPITVQGNHIFVSISAGMDHTCAVDVNSDLWCWGSNTVGQLGQGAVSAGGATPVMVAGLGIVDTVTAGDGFTCARTGGDTWCWGAGADGQLGNGGFGGSPGPSILVNNGYSQEVIAGAHTACRLIDTGTPAVDKLVECWGNDQSLQIGNGAPSTNVNVPETANITSVNSLMVGKAHVCVSNYDNFLYCWGDNGAGQLGRGTSGGPEGLPTEVSSLGASVQTLGRGYAADHMCIVTNNGTVQCWGNNSDGQVGLDPASSVVLNPSSVVGL